MACLLYNTGRCLQLRMFNCPNFGVHFRTDPPFLEPTRLFCYVQSSVSTVCSWLGRNYSSATINISLSSSMISEGF